MGRDLNFRWTKIEQPNEIQPIHLIANGSIKPSLSRVRFKCFCLLSQISRHCQLLIIYFYSLIKID